MRVTVRGWPGTDKSAAKSESEGKQDAKSIDGKEYTAGRGITIAPGVRIIGSAFADVADEVCVQCVFTVGLPAGIDQARCSLTSAGGSLRALQRGYGLRQPRCRTHGSLLVTLRNDVSGLLLCVCQVVSACVAEVKKTAVKSIQLVQIIANTKAFSLYASLGFDAKETLAHLEG